MLSVGGGRQHGTARILAGYGWSAGSKVGLWDGLMPRTCSRARATALVLVTPLEAERALWKMADDGRADCTHDRRFRALVLLATFASLRWGEATALTRADLDLRARTVRIKAAYAERSTGELLLGPPKSRAGRRVVGIPAAIIPDLRDHLAVYVKDQPGALVFPGQKGGPLRRGNFNKMSAWPHAVESIGMPGLHSHDLRHTGNAFASESKAGLKDLMARMATIPNGPR